MLGVGVVLDWEIEVFCSFLQFSAVGLNLRHRLQQFLWVVSASAASAFFQWFIFRSNMVLADIDRHDSTSFVGRKFGSFSYLVGWDCRHLLPSGSENGVLREI